MADGNVLGQASAETSGNLAILAEAREYLALCISADDKNREAALNDLQFIAGEQWDPRDRQQRALSGRPCLTINKLPTFLHQVTNDQRQNKMGAKIHPVGDEDEEKAEVVQGIVRHIEYASNASVATGTAVNSAATIGFGYYRLITRYCDEASFDQEIAFKRIRNAFTVYLDPAIQEVDGSDQMRCLISEKMPKAEFKRKYPNATVTAASLPLGTGDTTLSNWIGDSFVRVAEFYKVEFTKAWLVMTDQGPAWEKGEELLGVEDELPLIGAQIILKRGKPMRRESAKRKVMWRLITASDVLDEVEIPCKWIPVFPVFGDEVDLDGKVVRSGLVRHAKDPARMYNYWMFLSLDTPIPTMNGWTTVGSLKVGEKIFSDNGALTNVIGKSTVAIGKECFRVEFDDASSVVASGDHPWTVQERGKRKAKGFDWTEKTLRTDQLDPKQHAIKVCGALDLPDADLPVSPYFLGYWLGDGNTASGAITVGDQDLSDVVDLLAADGVSVGPVSKGNRANRFTALGEVTKLRALGVIGAKRIPAIYLRASVEQRQALLQGLMDTDGSIKSNGTQCNYTGSDPLLVADVRELMHSLGIKTGLTKRAGRVSKMANGAQIVSGESEVISFAAPEFQIFRIPRKLAAQKIARPRHQRRTLQRKIVAVVPVPSVPVQCISIDAPSHLYLCGTSMIPTHNTSATEEVALRPKSKYIGAAGQFEGYEDDWAGANVSSSPYLEYNPITIDGTLAPPPGRAPMADVPVGTVTMARAASDDIKATTGLFDSSLGNRGNATSGVQERAQQLQGDTANFHYQDNSQITYRHAIRCLLDMVPKIYDGARIVKMMGEDEQITSRQINDEAEGAVDITSATYDYTISVGPAYSTARQEATDALIELGKSWPKLMEIAGDKVVGSMDFHGSDDVAERIKRTIPPNIIGEQDKGPDGQPVVMTPHGPVTIEQAGQMIGQLSQDAEMLTGELQKAQQGIPKAQIDAQVRAHDTEVRASTAIEVAHINAEASKDVAELVSYVKLLLQKMQPPPVLAADVATDLVEDDKPQGAMQ